jgi:hypothetical protein
MKKLLALFLLTAAVLAAQSATLNLGPYGTLTIFLPGDWKIDSSHFANTGSMTITPAKPGVNASCTINISFPETDRYDTKAKLKLRVEADGYGPASESVEKKAIAKEFALTTGYGYYCNFTDPQLVGKPPEPGNFKTMSAGKIRLNREVLLDVSIVADGFSSEPYQQLLGAIEGLEFTQGSGK